MACPQCKQSLSWLVEEELVLTGVEIRKGQGKYAGETEYGETLYQEYTGGGVQYLCPECLDVLGTRFYDASHYID